MRLTGTLSSGLFTLVGFLFATTAHADHIITAQEGLGPSWWGVALMGPIPLIVAGTIIYLLYRASRGQREAEGEPDKPDRGFTP